MKTKVTIFVIISILLVSCGKQLTVSGTEVPTKAPVSIDTPMPDFTLSAMLHGNWLVETMDTDEDWTTLGTLAIDGNSYHFYPAPGVEIPSWMRDQFCFFKQSAGEVGYEYEPNVSPNDDLRTFDDHDILLRWTGIGCKEAFLVRVDQEDQELYLHAQVAEIQLYRIHKNYAN